MEKKPGVIKENIFDKKVKCQNQFVLPQKLQILALDKREFGG
jgi:hypothetical protein